MTVLVETIWFLLYLVGLFIISSIIQGCTLKSPKIYWVPAKSVHEAKYLSKKSEIEVTPLEDLDLF